MTETGRTVSTPTGERTYTEVMLRHTYPDGTVVDSEPQIVNEQLVEQVRKMAPTIRAAAQLASAMAKVRTAADPDAPTVQRFTRTVTTTATEWAPVPEDPPAPAQDDRP